MAIPPSNNPWGYPDPESLSYFSGTRANSVRFGNIYYGKDLKRELEECLEGIEAGGNFAAFGTSAYGVNPGLHVDGVGTIGFPLSKRDAADIIEKSHLAPFGKGEETVVDTAVRNTWEINPDQLQLRNPAWAAYLDSIAQNAKRELGVPDEVEIQALLHKLLLYEEGAMFKSHKDTQKAPGMFGTLVITLPSAHEGGSVKASHHGAEMDFDTAGPSAYNNSWIAWYSDVKHSVLPVTAGIRCVLVYNLCRMNAQELPSAGRLVKQRNELQGILEKWRTNMRSHPHRDFPARLVHVLEHAYIEGDMNLRCLKGRDRMVVSCLREASKDMGFIILLGKLERNEYWPHEDCDDADKEVHTRLDSIVDVTGKPALGTIKLDDDIIQQHVFDRDADSQSDDDEGYTGNEGQPLTYRYHETAALILTKKEYISENYRHNSNSFACIEKFVKEFTTPVVADPTTPGALEDFEIACNLVTQDDWLMSMTDDRSPSEAFTKESILSELLRCCIIANRVDLMDIVLSRCKKGMPLRALSYVARAIHDKGFAWYKTSLHKSFSNISDLSTYWAKLAELSSFLNSEIKGPDSEYRLWREALVGKVLRSLPSGTQSDVDCLFSMARELGDEWLVQQAIPIIRECHISKPTFILEFLARLLENNHDEQASRQPITSVFSELIKAVIPHLTLHAEPVERPRKRQRPEVGVMTMRRQESPPITTINPAVGPSIAKVIGQCVALGLKDEESSLVTAITNDANKLSAQEYLEVAFPFLRKLLKLLKTENVSLSSAQYRTLFQTLIHTGTLVCVDKEPEKQPKDWVRPKSGCASDYGRGCDDCQELDRFLTDAYAETAKFQWSKKRLGHLEMQVSPGSSWSARLATPRAKGCSTRYEGTWLVITKTWRGWQEEHDDWTTNKLQPTLDKIRALGDEANLRIILADQYDYLVNLRSVRLADGQAFWDPNARPAEPGTGCVLIQKGSRVNGHFRYTVRDGLNGSYGAEYDINSIMDWQQARSRAAAPNSASGQRNNPRTAADAAGTVPAFVQHQSGPGPAPVAPAYTAAPPAPSAPGRQNDFILSPPVLPGNTIYSNSMPRPDIAQVQPVPLQAIANQPGTMSSDVAGTKRKRDDNIVDMTGDSE